MNGKRREYQPKTGQVCSCRKGVQRDNCPSCEGTGMVIDFRAIREREPKYCDKTLANGEACGNTHLISEGKCPVHWEPVKTSKPKPVTYTPGPWTLGETVHEHKMGSLWAVPVWANEAESGDKIAGEAVAMGRERARANARLIAAAPEMLDTMKAILDYAEKHDLGMSSPIEELAREAIAKAEGE